MESIGKKIQMLRRMKQMTQLHLAEVLSVSAQTVSKWENDLTSPDITLLPMIARYFGITMDELFNYRLNYLNYRERFIRFMADNGVLQFGEFQLKSGRVSPYLINTGNYRTSSQISRLGEFYAECMREHNVEPDLLMGNTRKEIPVLIATGLSLYDRYGIDMHYDIGIDAGKLTGKAGSVTLIKDTLTSGNTLRQTLDEYNTGTSQRVSDIIVSVDRMERGKSMSLTARQEIERQYNVKIHTIVTVEDIIFALEKGVIGGAEYLEAIKDYQNSYGGNGNGNGN